MELNDIFWSDWRRLEHIQETLASIGKQPLSPVEAIPATWSYWILANGS